MSPRPPDYGEWTNKQPTANPHCQQPGHGSRLAVAKVGRHHVCEQCKARKEAHRAAATART